MDSCFIQWAASIHFGGQIVLDLANGSLFKLPPLSWHVPIILSTWITFWHYKTLQAPLTLLLS